MKRTEGYRTYLDSQGKVDQGKRKREPKILGEPMLVRQGTNPTTVTVCMALRKAVKRGPARAIFGLPLFLLEGVLFPGPTPDPRKVLPSGGWDFLEKGVEEAAPAFSLYELHECGKNVLQGD